MTAATRMVWELAGRPDIIVESTRKHLKAEPATCALCGEHSEVTADFNRALGKNFTDRSLIVYRSGRVCPACLWCCSGKPPATLRMWSIVAAEGTQCRSQPKAFMQATPGLTLTNRADTRPVIDMLAAPPAGDWIVSLAVSGQKHVLPYAHVNRGTGLWTVRMEDTNVVATPTEFAWVYSAALDLRRMGVPADAVESGEPRFIKTSDALSEWRRLDSQIAAWHLSPLLHMALWLITKPIIKEGQSS